jgi:FtsZ-binding cell division protein ZapB
MKLHPKTALRSALGTGSLLGAAALVAALGLSAGEAESAAAPQDGLDTTRQALEEWVETRRLISLEKRDHALGRQALEDRVDLLEREIAALRERTDDARSSIAEADRKRDELLSESEALKAASTVYAERVAALEARTRELLAGLPEPVLDRVKKLSQRIPEDPAETKLGTAERFLNIVGILNEVDRFNREITLSSEVHELPNGKPAEVAVMYVGLGQGYYVTNSGDAAAVGSAGPDGWTWTARNDAAADITAAIDILKGKEVARYVRLPIQVD